MTPVPMLVRCAAKINLYLDVLGERGDGFHDIETFFQPVSLYDEIRLSPIGKGIVLTGDDKGIAWDEGNLCHRAARSLIESTGFDGGVRIDVHKEIPSGGGLGGGSSDAAAVLAGLNLLFDLRLNGAGLNLLALELGSDVPFFLFGHPAIGRGRGTELERAQGLKEGWIVLVKPNVNISTKWAYENLNLMLTRVGDGDKLKCLLKGLKDFPDKRLETFNSFERIVVGRYPETGEILRIFDREGAVLGSLSGSGSACFGLFRDESRAVDVRNLMLEKGFFARIVKPVNRTFEFFRFE